MFTEQEKDLIKTLVKKELDDVKEENSTIVHKSAQFTKDEVTYEEFLKQLMDKL